MTGEPFMLVLRQKKPREEVLAEINRGVAVNCDLILQEQPSGIAALIIHVPAGEFIPEVGKTYRLIIEEVVDP